MNKYSKQTTETKEEKKIRKPHPLKKNGAANETWRNRQKNNPQQIWVWDDTPVTGKHDQQSEGHWEKI